MPLAGPEMALQSILTVVDKVWGGAWGQFPREPDLLGAPKRKIRITSM
jgi:hypothetical protein